MSDHSKSSQRFRSSLIGTCLTLLLAGSTLATEPIYSSYTSMIPSRSQGGVSPYNNITPQIVKSTDDGIGQVIIPSEGKKEISLVWWYANHVIGRLDKWPQGSNARLKVVVKPDQGFTGTVSVALEAEGKWTNGGKTAEVTFPGEEETSVLVPLPESATKVGKVRVIFAAQDPLPNLTVTSLSAGSLSTADLALPDAATWRTTNPVKVSGRAEGKAGDKVAIKALNADKKTVAEWSAVLGEKGEFTFEVDRKKLPAGSHLKLVPSVSGKGESTGDYPFFAFPVLDPAKKLPRVTREGSVMQVDGKPYAFLGVNYTPFQLGLSRKADYELVAQNFGEMKEWGITAIRLTMGMAMIQPAPGVFPDSPEYKNILKKANLDPEFFDLLRYAIDLARHYEIRIVFDWHESLMDQHRYFLGGDPANADTDKPGTPLAWLAMSRDQYPKEDHPLFVSMDNPKHLEALFSSTSWLAGAFKGEAAVLGYEVPYNEPHERLISNDRNWRWLVVQTADRVKKADPDALTFGMPSGWGHENVFVSSTWLIPEVLDGMTPHFYLSNGPIPVRPDSKDRKYPYLAREVEPSLSLGLTALGLPYSAAGYPYYNGEGGGHGVESFLPDMPRDEGTRIMIEAQMVQAYATGMSGYFEWTMWNNTFWTETTVPNRVLFERYSPLFQQGPVNYDKADILFVQNPAAVPVANGHNFSAVPFARIVLDLHLQPVHYMTDAQLIFSGQTMFSRGFEQVHSLASGLGNYKAIIIDTRNVDQRAVEIVRKSGIPVLEFGQDKPIDGAACAEFLKANKVPFDDKTSVEFQWVQGPGHLLVYRRSAGDATKIFPILRKEGKFKLVSEDGKVAYEGDAAKLAGEGMTVKVEKWTGAIFTIK